MVSSSLTDAEVRRIIGQPTNAYDTHRPVLAEAIIRTTGPLLELGMGEGSSLGLHEIAWRTHRKVRAYEDDPAWFETMTERCHTGPIAWTHYAELVSNWDEADLSGEWSVAFVDHGQMQRRVREIGRVADNAEIVVVHDTEDWRYQYWAIYALFKYRYDYRAIKPWTTAFSNTIDVSKWVIP